MSSEGRTVMQRYDLEAVNYYGFCFDYEMNKDEDGEWVRYDDAAARIAELEADRDRLAAIVERARNRYPQFIDWIEDFMAIEAATKGGE